ncbi:IS110 family transposase [Jejudonia soesokkakensis]|uniref:IS110 family transposase n=1 Tax=Jejudonia soesokkakensis TaxID=1323432 RepID=A0ABW2MP73_9FLAO
MNKIKVIVGIDISKNVFDTYSLNKGHYQYTNNISGFRLFKKSLSKAHWCIMEATSCYHYQLACFLSKKGVNVSVVNPLIIKRFIQMKLNRIKTDKSDAEMIFQYGIQQPLELWHPNPAYIEQCKMIQTVIQLYFKQTTSIKNKIHALQSRGHIHGKMVRSLKRQLKMVLKEIEFLEIESEKLIEIHQKNLYTSIQTIPGIGRKTALLLIISTNGFKDFTNAKQVSSYFGFAPNERTSGSSVRGRSRISKAGNPIVRNHLFLCSFTASENNPQCKALYDRIVKKGKSKKLALVAVCNKLIKQSFAIAKSGIPYDMNYSTKLQKQ